MKYPKRCQYKHAKQKKYHVRNWAEYNEGLRRRGDLTVWFDEEAIANWKADKTGKPGGQRVYSDMAIETGLVVRMVYKLAYRQTEGFLHSIASLLGLGIEIPDYSTLCRRSRLLRKKLRIPKAASTQPIHLMIDSTGLRIHVGNARKPPKQRAWRKLHIAVDRETGNIVASELTASRARDATRVPALLTQIQAPLVSVAADSAYDKEAVYEAIEAHSPGRRTRVVIPPQRNATLSQNSNTAMQERDRCLRYLLLVMCTHPCAKEALTLHLERSEGHQRYFGCNLMHRRVLASSHQHLMAEAPQLRVSRPKLVSFFAKQSAATVLLEACGSAHFWARTLRRLGHDVVLLPVLCRNSAFLK